MSKLSIIIPVYYNEQNIPFLFDKLNEEIFSNPAYEHELIFVDDGSGDNSYGELLKLQSQDSSVKVIKLSRNFGSHTAILAGLTYATGDCATVISADLQDPPEIINRMFEKWKSGNKVVLAVREDREESFTQKLFSNTYYKMMKRYALPNMPEGGFDCFLIDRKVITILTSIEEKNTTLMGQILWCGFKTEKIYYIRKEREIGKSRWTLAKKIKLFIDSFLAFSYVPIRFMSLLGVIISLLSFLTGIVLIINKLIIGVNVQGWTSLMVLFLFIAGIQMIMMGIIGEYLWRNMDEARKRPVFIIDEKVGFHK
ncbi:glycosyltransferase family 2 protein [Neobacillus sp. PS3-12]|uniref:glycosyltransferase family 2 protein n=1 Tax=Neobacillus sp. PS3-12 TaxID=3070677 RepID=UPI0027E19B4D|nr:glycosyltransferase family 2 protein [Neobacillus sp. PS3-12]WML54783.1 glycosyltransferase family 2 protein [Neobacillus sp. PS3-12]